MVRDPLVTKPVIQLADIVEDAQFSFWEQVVKHLPLAEGGDFDPMSSHQFDLAIEEAVTTWWTTNASEPYDLDIGHGRILEGADCNCSADDDCQCAENIRFE